MDFIAKSRYFSSAKFYAYWCRQNKFITIIYKSGTFFVTQCLTVLLLNDNM